MNNYFSLWPYLVLKISVQLKYTSMASVKTVSLKIFTFSLIEIASAPEMLSRVFAVLQQPSRKISSAVSEIKQFTVSIPSDNGAEYTAKAVRCDEYKSQFTVTNRLFHVHKIHNLTIINLKVLIIPIKWYHEYHKTLPPIVLKWNQLKARS